MGLLPDAAASSSPKYPSFLGFDGRGSSAHCIVTLSRDTQGATELFWIEPLQSSRVPKEVFVALQRQRSTVLSCSHSTYM